MASTKQRVSKPARKSAVSKTDTQGVFDFVSLLAHDLESPLASLKYTLAMIQTGSFDPSNPAHQRLVNSASSAMERAETIVADILDVAKFESAETVVAMQEVNLFGIASDAVQVATGVAAEYRTILELTPESEKHRSAVVEADPRLLGRILDNLIFNAIRHTPQNGKVVVGLETLSGRITLDVVDSGEGLGEVDPEHLFEKFAQASARKKGKHRGVGLGLYFCRLAARQMQADIFAENANSGGARFGITFTA